MNQTLLASGITLALAASLAHAADADPGVLDLRPLQGTPLECMHIQVAEMPGATAVCSTSVRRFADVPLEAPVTAFVVKAKGPVIAVMQSSSLTPDDRRAIGQSFEKASTRCIWERETRVVRIADAYAALYTVPLAGALQPVVALMTPFAAREHFGDGTDAVGDCKPAI